MELFSQIIINSIIAGAIYTLIALGFNLTYGVAKFFNFAHGVYAVIAGYVVYYLFTILGMNLYISIALGILAAGLLGLLSERMLFLPLRKKQASAMITLVASLGFFITVQSIIAMMFTSDFLIIKKSPAVPKNYEVFGGVITEFNVFVIIITILISTGLIFFLNKTKFGKAVKAITDDPEVARIVGVNTNRIIGITFIIGASIAGIAGVLVGLDTGIMPTIGMGLLLKGVTVAIVGGCGNLYGGIIGSVLLGLVENFGVMKISSQWKDSISFGVLIIFLLFRPNGIFRD